MSGLGLRVEGKGGALGPCAVCLSPTVAVGVLCAAALHIPAVIRSGGLKMGQVGLRGGEGGIGEQEEAGGVEGRF